MSERAYRLTHEVLLQSTGSYTCWEFRRKLIDELGLDLTEEFKIIDKMTRFNIKNYQIWHHRRCLVEKMNDKSFALNDLDFIDKILNLDQKNYHA